MDTPAIRSLEVRKTDLQLLAQGAHPGLTALLEGIIGAAMLFSSSKDELGYYSYLARAYERSLTSSLRRAGREREIDAINEHGPCFFPKEDGQIFEEYNVHIGKTFGSREIYEHYKTTKLFTASGKGSIIERKDKGMFCGFCFQRMLNEKCTMSDAIEYILQIAIQFQNDGENYYGQFRGLFRNNFQNNIWPIFKDSAHMWAVYACSQFSSSGITVDFQDANPAEQWLPLENMLVDAQLTDKGLFYEGMGLAAFLQACQQRYEKANEFNESGTHPYTFPLDSMWRIFE